MNMDGSESAVAAASNMLISSLEKSAGQGKFLNFSLPMERLCKFLSNIIKKKQIRREIVDDE